MHILDRLAHKISRRGALKYAKFTFCVSQSVQFSQFGPRVQLPRVRVGKNNLIDVTSPQAMSIARPGILRPFSEINKEIIAHSPRR